MHHSTPHRVLTCLALSALVLTMVACDTDVDADGIFATAEVQALYTSVTSEITLSDAREARFASALHEHDHANRSAGYLWNVADFLSQTLTEEQKQELINRTGPLQGGMSFRGLFGFPGSGGYYGVGGFIGASRHFGESPADEVLNQTEKQQAEIQAIHEAFRAEFKALVASRRNSSLSDEEFLRQIRALNEALRSDVEGVLTAKQLANLEAYRAEHEAEFEAFRAEVAAVRNAVLGLTATESETFDALLAAQLEAREILIEQFEAGDLSLAGLDAEIEALQAATAETLQALLTEAQYEVVQLHDALPVRLDARGHRGRMGPHR